MSSATQASQLTGHVTLSGPPAQVKEHPSISTAAWHPPNPATESLSSNKPEHEPSSTVASWL